MGLTGTKRGADPTWALCRRLYREAEQLSCHEDPADIIRGGHESKMEMQTQQSGLQPEG